MYAMGKKNAKHPHMKSKAATSNNLVVVCGAYHPMSIANGDFNQSNESTSHLVHLLDSISSDSDSSAFQALELIYNYLISPSLDQAVTDALSFDLPKAAAKLGCVSERCYEYAERIVNRFVESCSPRDMVSILCEAMNTPSDECNNSSYFSPLLGALAKVKIEISYALFHPSWKVGSETNSQHFNCNLNSFNDGQAPCQCDYYLPEIVTFQCIFEAPQRRQFEQVKTALPVVFKVLEAMLSDPEDEDTRSVDLLEKAILVASSLKAICVKIDHKDEKLFALFGMYILQIT
ncbi:aberrant root formation protein 4 isoform X1, partial [Tanacetum coccineum]